MIALITTYATTQAAMWAGGSILAFVLAWIFKKIPNEKISKNVEKFFYGLGVAVTLGASKKLKIYNKTVEPFLVDLIDNVIGSAVRGFIKGLRSDNK